jgi:hypothetical protein
MRKRNSSILALCVLAITSGVLQAGVGPIDVASGAAGQAHVLAEVFFDDSLGFFGPLIWQLDGSGDWTSAPAGGFAAYPRLAISDGSDGLSRILQVDRLGSGPVDLWIVGPAGSYWVGFFALPGWTAVDLSVGPDNQTHLLWTSLDGEVRIDATDSYGSPTVGPAAVYGPYAGWSARAIADGPDGATWILWRHLDGRAGVARYRDGLFEAAFRWSASAAWTAEDIAVGSDGLPRVLWTNEDGRMGIGTVDVEGQMFDRKTYGSPGRQARRIGASSDGMTRVLWTDAHGGGSLWLLNPDNSVQSEHPTPEPRVR